VKVSSTTSKEKKKCEINLIPETSPVVKEILERNGISIADWERLIQHIRQLRADGLLEEKSPDDVQLF
jgi:hypothetical protein